MHLLPPRPLSNPPTQGRLVYNTDKLEMSTMTAMASAFAALCGAVAADANTPINALSLLDSSERQALGTLSAAPYRPDYLSELPVHLAFEAHAQRTPGAPCLIFDEQTLSYAEVRCDAGRFLFTGGSVRAGSVGWA